MTHGVSKTGSDSRETITSPFTDAKRSEVNWLSERKLGRWEHFICAVFIAKGGFDVIYSCDADPPTLLIKLKSSPLIGGLLLKISNNEWYRNSTMVVITALSVMPTNRVQAVVWSGSFIYKNGLCLRDLC